MLSQLGRSVLSSALRLSPIYRNPLIYPVGSGYRTPSGGYRTPISYRASSTTSDGDSDFEPIPPIILYTDGIRGSQEKGSHVGIGIYVDNHHEMNLYLPVPKNENTLAFRKKNPELQAIRLALYRLYKWPEFMMEDVIIRTHFDPILDEFEKWRNGDHNGSRSLQDVWREMDMFANVRIEKADRDDYNHEIALDMAIRALEDAESEDVKMEETKPASVHLGQSLKYPLSLNSKRKDEKKDDEE